ncbi:membrane protein [Lentzea cavernae]|uniref:Membrane protein n=1 Tax=Lentzea cavernae TaxID=2020703 RepID=A0ABQ3MDG6_9PSEU|nr:membrane protein [Lentzea cavernae]
MRAVEDLRAADRPAAALTAAAKRLMKPRLAEALRGSWLGHPLHPLMITVPIGAWVCASALDARPGNEDAARRLTAIGLAAAPPAVVLGLADYADLNRRQRRVGVVHAIANTAALACFTASYAARKREAHIGGKVLSLLGLAAMGAGGALGGHLAYAQGAGVFRWQRPLAAAAPTGDRQFAGSAQG